MTSPQVPDKPVDDMKLDELLDMWDILNKLDLYCVKHMGYKNGANTILARLRRDVSERIADESAKRRVRQA